MGTVRKKATGTMWTQCNAVLHVRMISGIWRWRHISWCNVGEHCRSEFDDPLPNAVFTAFLVARGTYKSRLKLKFTTDTSITPPKTTLSDHTPLPSLNQGPPT